MLILDETNIPEHTTDLIHCYYLSENYEDLKILIVTSNSLAIFVFSLRKIEAQQLNYEHYSIYI